MSHILRKRFGQQGEQSSASAVLQIKVLEPPQISLTFILSKMHDRG